MQVECIKPFGLHDVGDLAEVPDGAVFDEQHWRPADAAPETPPEPSSPSAPAVFPVATPTEM